MVISEVCHIFLVVFDHKLSQDFEISKIWFQNYVISQDKFDKTQGIIFWKTFPLKARFMEHLLYNFRKYFSGTRVSQVLDKCLNGCLAFAICYFQPPKNDVYKTFAW